MKEKEIVTKLIEHDPEGQKEFVKIYGDKLVRSAYLICGNEADAQDLTQKTLIQAIKYIKRFKGKSSLYSWLYGILLNIYRNHLRKHKHTVLMPKIPTQKVAPASITRKLDMELGAAPLAKAIGKLSAEHQQVIVLRFYEDLKISDISLRTGVPVGTVKSRLHHALTQLRKVLKKE